MLAGFGTPVVSKSDWSSFCDDNSDCDGFIFIYSSSFCAHVRLLLHLNVAWNLLLRQRNARSSHAHGHPIPASGPPERRVEAVDQPAEFLARSLWPFKGALANTFFYGGL